MINSLYKNATSCIKWRNKTSEVFEIEQGVRQGGANRIPIRTKVATGNYILQSNRAKFNKCEVSATCKICNKEDETIEQYLISCIHLEPDREIFLKVIREQCLRLVELFNISLDINLRFMTPSVAIFVRTFQTSIVSKLQIYE